jgi:hypothetical protein
LPGLEQVLDIAHRHHRGLAGAGTGIDGQMTVEVEA